MESILPLDDIRVLDLGDMVAAPFASKILADLGAEVIKLEPPIGERARHYGPFPNDEPNIEKSGLFLYQNTNKFGGTLDLYSEEGRSLLNVLTSKVDIIIHNTSPDLAQYLQITYDDLKLHNDSLIMLSISPYGLTGPYSTYKGHEINSAALSGVTLQLGLPDRPPLNPPLFLGHSQVGLVGAMSAMIALTARDMTGVGQHIDVSEADCWATYHNGIGLSQWLFSSRVTMRQGRHGRGGPYPNTILPCKDGEIRMQLFSAREWQRLLDVMGNPEWGNDPRFQDRLEMNRLYSDEVDAHISDWFKDYTKAELFDKFYEYKVPFTPVNTVTDFFHHPQMAARNFFVDVTHPEAGTTRQPGPPYKLSETPISIRRPAPLLGEHNDYIYGEILGMSDTEVATLRDRAII